jgi:hypothetical protein
MRNSWASGTRPSRAALAARHAPARYAVCDPESEICELDLDFHRDIEYYRIEYERVAVWSGGPADGAWYTGNGLPLPDEYLCDDCLKYPNTEWNGWGLLGAIGTGRASSRRTATAAPLKRPGICIPQGLSRYPFLRRDIPSAASRSHR